MVASVENQTITFLFHRSFFVVNVTYLPSLNKIRPVELAFSTLSLNSKSQQGNYYYNHEVLMLPYGVALSSPQFVREKQECFVQKKLRTYYRSTGKIFY